MVARVEQWLESGKACRVGRSMKEVRRADGDVDEG